MGALASEEGNLRETIAELPQVLEAASPALDNLNAAFPPTRAWALEMIPGVRETPATIEAGFPWIRQTRALAVASPSCRGWWTSCSPRCADFAEFTDGQVDFLPLLDAFNRCQLEVVLPTRSSASRTATSPPACATTRSSSSRWSRCPASRRTSTATASYVRFQAGGGGYPVQTPPVGPGRPAARERHRAAARHAARPRAPKPPYKPNVKCHTQPVPNLTDARDRGRPVMRQIKKQAPRVRGDPVPARRWRSGSAATSCRTSASTCPPGCPVARDRLLQVDAELQTGQAVVPGQGQTVNIAGVKVGEVGYVTLEDGRAVVQMKIQDEYRPIYKDATVLLRPKTGLKDMYLALDPGTQERRRAARGRPRAGGEHAARRERRRDPGRARRRHARLPAHPAERGRHGLRRRGHGRRRALHQTAAQDLRETFKRFEPTARYGEQAHAPAGQAPPEHPRA